MKKKPTKLRLLEGRRGAKQQFDREPKPRPKAPPIPSSIDPEAKRTWKALAPKLEKLGLLTEADGDAFAALCQIRSRIVFLNRHLRKRDQKSLLQIDSKGVAKPHPYVTMEKHYFQLFRLYCTEFGLTPRGRSGIAVSTSDDDEGAHLIR